MWLVRANILPPVDQNGQPKLKYRALNSVNKKAKTIKEAEAQSRNFDLKY